MFFHTNWVKHRSNDRYLKLFTTFFDSGVIRSLSNEILGVMGTLGSHIKIILFCILNQ